MLNLYDYQVKSIDSLRDGFKNGHRKQIFYLPTGGGKTECAIY
ncbi:Helicase/UvrB, N-terminal, partial [uncultured Caudovirales phage]